MQSLTRILRTTQLTMLLALAAGLALQPVQAAPGGGKGGGGGGGGKVTVTAADPGEADQGTELDVFITGDGFDAGSAATFYVGGTSDDSQITVLSNEYQPSTGQLKSRVRVNGAALVTDYDIEVRNSSGRRGKGTTLFRVKQADSREACTGLEDPTPTIAYLSEVYQVGDVNTWDLYLSSASGCDQTFLLAGARQVIPRTAQSDGEKIAGLDDLQIHVEGGRGLVLWADNSGLQPVVEGMEFTYDASGVTLLTTEPVALFTAPVDLYLAYLDLAQNASGELELALNFYGTTETGGWWFASLNLDTGAYEELIDGSSCQLTYATDTCYPAGRATWGSSADEIVIQSRTADYSDYLFARMRRVDGTWNEPRPVLRLSPEHIEMGTNSDVSAGSLTLYNALRETTNKRGKLTGRVREYWVIDLDSCTAEAPCISGEGAPVAESIAVGGPRWTPDEQLLISQEQSQGSFRLAEYDLLTEATRELEITGVYYSDFDVSR